MNDWNVPWSKFPNAAPNKWRRAPGMRIGSVSITIIIASIMVAQPKIVSCHSSIDFNVSLGKTELKRKIP